MIFTNMTALGSPVMESLGGFIFCFFVFCFFLCRNSAFRLCTCKPPRRSVFLCALRNMGAGGDRRGAAARKNAARGDFSFAAEPYAAFFGPFPPEAGRGRSPPAPLSLARLCCGVLPAAALDKYKSVSAHKSPAYYKNEGIKKFPK